MTYRFVDHTADVGAEIEAATLDALFAEAAAAFTDTLTVREGVRAVDEVRVELVADDLDELMVEWLDELNFRFETEGLLVAEAAVEIEPRAAGRASGGRESGWHLEKPSGDKGSPGGWHLSAVVRGEAYEPERHPVKVLIKAVTYYRLEVRETEGGGWFARMIFDL